MIRQVTIPEDAVLSVEGQDEDVQIPFRQFMDVLLNHKRWQKDVESLRLSMELQQAFKGKVPGEVVDVSDEAWRGLKEALDPSSLRSPEIGRRMLEAGFFAAIEQAPKKSGTESASPSKGKGRRKR